jgi:hypothetical protein
MLTAGEGGQPVTLSLVAAQICRKGGPRAILEVKSPHIPMWMYEARLRGYDRKKAAKAKKRGKGDG